MSNLPMKRGGFHGGAAVLSFFVPGLGQLYRGHVGAFVFFLVATAIGYSLLLVPGFLIHFFCILHAGGARD